MELGEVESEISKVYQWWHETKPGVHPREVGRLAQLWRQADYLYSLERT